MDAILAEMGRIKEEAPRAVREQTREQAERLLETARSRAPRVTGALADSGRVRKTKRGHDVTFGNKSVPYANYQHEHVGLKHKQGGAKFLEQPMNEQVDGMQQEWQDALDRALGA